MARRGSFLCVVVVAYEAEETIEGVLDRIPPVIAGERPLILVADDCSSDGTARLAEGWAASHPEADVVVIRRPVNLGYGGNQLASFEWADREGAGTVVLMHGDGQYPPERIPDLVAPIDADEADAVFGSRMVVPRNALAGRMPWRRYVGNRTLTKVLNVFGRSNLTEWFSGFRAYRVSALRSIGYDALPMGFEIDTALTFRLLETGGRLHEIEIPTRYAGEISRVPLIRTGLLAIRLALTSTRWRRGVAGPD